MRSLRVAAGAIPFLSVVAAIAGPAQGATVSYDPGRGLQIAAPPGEVNRMTVLGDSQSASAVKIRPGGTPLTVGAGCSQQPFDTVRCVLSSVKVIR